MRRQGQRQRRMIVDGVIFSPIPGGWATTRPSSGRWQALKNENDYRSCGSRWMLVAPVTKQTSYHPSLRAIVAAIREAEHASDGEAAQEAKRG